MVAKWPQLLPSKGRGAAGQSLHRRRAVDVFRTTLAIAAGLVAFVPPAQGQETPVPERPFLQIDAGMHTAPIRGLAYAERAGIVATASEDKTTRLWSVADGRLISTLRVPLGPRFEGALHSVALDDAAELAVLSGNTGVSWDRAASIYVAKPQNGSLAGRIPKLPSEVFATAFQPGTSVFAIGLDGRGGILVIQPGKGLLARDNEDYEVRVRDLDFAEDGRLASAAGATVRLYDTAYRRTAVYDAPDGLQPGRIAFSPDGTELAVGYTDAPRVDILDAATLEPVHTITEEQATRRLNAVAWSSNGGEAVLFAAGTVTDDDGDVLLMRYSKGGRGAVRRTPLSRDAVTDLLGLPGGGVLFAAADPTWGRVQHDGKLHYQLSPVTLDFRDAADRGFAVSGSGRVVDFPAGETGGDSQILRFDLESLVLTPLAEGDRPGTAPSATDKQLEVTDWRNEATPRISGQAVELDAMELARSVDVLPQEAGVLLGGDYKLRWFDRQGSLTAEIETPAAVYGIASDANAELAIAALGDGTLRWYGLSNAGLRPLLSLFPHADGRRWVAWTPEGFFAHSDSGGQDLVGYALNRNKALSPDWITFKQLYRKFYAPQLVRGQLDPGGATASQLALVEIGSIAVSMDDRPPPRIEVLEYCLIESEELEGAGPQGTDTQGAGGAEEETCFPVTAATRGFQRVGPVRQEAQDGGAGELPQPAAGQDSGKPAQVTQLPEQARRLVLRVAVEDTGAGLGDVDIFLNGRNVGRQNTRGFERVAAQDQGTAADTGAGQGEPAAGEMVIVERQVPLDPGSNEFQVRAYNAFGIFGESDKLLFEVPERPAERTLPPVLHVVAAGIDAYGGSVTPLNFAVADASAFANAVTAGARARYGRVEAHVLRDAEATLAGVRRALREVAAAARPQDGVLIYFAGHGLVLDDVYYFATADVTSIDSLAERGLDHLTLVELLGDIAAKNIMLFLDTCYAGAFDFNGASNLANESGHLLLAGSTSLQEALDSYNGENGVFAYAVLSALEGKAANYRGIVDALSLGSYVSEEVPDLAAERHHQQQALFRSSGGDLRAFPIVEKTPADEAQETQEAVQ